MVDSLDWLMLTNICKGRRCTVSDTHNNRFACIQPKQDVRLLPSRYNHLFIVFVCDVTLQNEIPLNYDLSGSVTSLAALPSPSCGDREHAQKVSN